MKNDSQNPNHTAMNSRKVEREIIVVGDPFRITADRGSQRWTWIAENNCKWIVRLLRASLIDCVDAGIHVADPEQLGVELPDLTEGSHVDDMRRWLEQATHPVANDIAEKCRGALAGKVVVGIELPMHFRKLVEECAAEFIGVDISPFRFTEEFLLRVEAPEPVRKLLQPHAVLDQDLRQVARLLALKIGDVATEAQYLPDRFGVIAAQVQFDRSLIRGEGFLTLADFADEVKALVDRHGCALILLHPHTTFVAGLKSLCELKGVRVGRGNSYRLLAGPHVAELATISSSLGDEAPYFGVPATVWARSPQSDNGDSGDSVEVTATTFVELMGTALCGPTTAPEVGKSSALRSNVILRKDIVDDWSLDRALTACQAIPTFALQTPQGSITAADSSFAPALTCGWHDAEEWGVWGNQGVSILSLSWPEPDVQELAIILELMSLAKSDQLSKDVHVFADGRRVATVKAPNSFSSTKTLLKVRCTGQQLLQLWLRSDPVVPQDLDTNARDLRTIGVGLIGVAWKKVF
jgi:hypothetical protein